MATNAILERRGSRCGLITTLGFRDTLEIGRTVLGGPDLEARFNAPAGNVYHVDPLPSRFGPLKPALGLGSYRTPVGGFYLSGAGTHPVGGVCGLPGKLAAQTLLREERTGGGSPIRRLRSVDRGAGPTSRPSPVPAGHRP